MGEGHVEHMTRTQWMPVVLASRCQVLPCGSPIARTGNSLRVFLRSGESKSHCRRCDTSSVDLSRRCGGYWARWSSLGAVTRLACTRALQDRSFRKALTLLELPGLAAFNDLPLTAGADGSAPRRTTLSHQVLANLGNALWLKDQPWQALDQYRRAAAGPFRSGGLPRPWQRLHGSPGV